MRTAPNVRHSKLLKNMCNELELCDPFRAKYPNRQEFTYVPRIMNRNNRSRIDFFIVSNSLLPDISACEIATNLQNKLFDHKAILLSFKDPPRIIKQPTISRSILKDSELDLVVSLSIAESYLHHITIPDVNADVIQSKLTQVGRSKLALISAGPDSMYLPPNFRSEEQELERAGIIAGIKETVDDLRIVELADQDLLDEYDDDIFMETLINNLRNDVISYQTFIQRTVKNTKQELLSQLRDLKIDYSLNSDKIFELEEKLSSMSHSEILNKIEGCRDFNIINGEKITPFFLSLATSNKAEVGMNCIKNDDGLDFNNTEEMKDYVRNYYAKLYTPPQSDANYNVNCIEEFLGDEICNSQLVRDSKIPANLAQEFERNLTIEELDASAMQGNNSAAGMDGINNAFIKKYWTLLRKPLFKYSNCCHTKGRLTANFRTASIKLIPKKGDTSNIKNWRPISLLSCLYKVISRALNNRLKKARSYIFSRAQKGFTSDRQIQEVLINVIETIAHCKKNNISGAILSIDQAKAFDTVSHKFMNSVYKFFGFGPNFVNLLETLGNNRTACISFDDGSHSPPFDLGCGRAQGNTSSPIEYNMAQQIVLFKIELCPEIRTVYLSHLIHRPYLPMGFEETGMVPYDSDSSNKKFINECSGETKKADSFADDNSTGTLLEINSLLALKSILENFGRFSGLKCNTDKTVLMPVGNVGPVPDDIRDLGFKISDSIHILGMNIDANLENLDSNFDRTLDSVRRSIEFWHRYNLSLPGRINVIKSLLFPLILYLGSIIMPSKRKINDLQKLLDDFAIGTMNYSRARVCLPANAGGMGLFDIEEFLTAQQAIWIIRANQSTRDCWRFRLRQLCNGNVLCAGPEIIDVKANPILHGLAKSYQRVRVAHDTLHENYLKSYVYCNPLFYRDRGNKRVLTMAYLELDETGFQKLACTRFEQFFNNEGIMTRVEMRIVLGIDLTITGYADLCKSLNLYVNRIRVNQLNNGTSVSFHQEYGTLKKPGKKLRKLLTTRRQKPFNFEDQLTTRTFLNLTGLEFPNLKNYGICTSLWNRNGLSNRFKTFLFRFYNNILGLNTRLSHFVPNISRKCTFCEITDGVQSVDESFIHIFFDCRHVRDWQSQFVRKYLPDLINPDLTARKKMWFFGILPDAEEAEFFIAVSILCFQFCIWEAKLEKKIPSFHTLEISFSEQINSLLRLNRDARDSATKTNNSLCRQFGYGYRPAANHGPLPPANLPAPRPPAPAAPALPAPVQAPGRWNPPRPRVRADPRPP
jgi:hypothetical protein